MRIARTAIIQACFAMASSSCIITKEAYSKLSAKTMFNRVLPFFLFFSTFWFVSEDRNIACSVCIFYVLNDFQRKITEYGGIFIILYIVTYTLGGFKWLFSRLYFLLFCPQSH